MIGMALKKLAKENGLRVDSGVAYGYFKGFAVTFSEGAGYKRMDIITKAADPEKKQQLDQKLGEVDVLKTYWVQQLAFGPKCATVIFTDNPGTMKKLNAFVDWFFPMLTEYCTQEVELCAECGGAVSDSWYLINGVAYPMHDACAAKLQESIDAEAKEKQEQDEGSYVRGALGAFLGAFLGGIVWALILYAGYVTAIVGLLIGWLADLGYKLFKGKQGKGKLIILILAIIFGVLVGTVLPSAFSLGVMIADGELPGYGYGDIPAMIIAVFQGDPEYRSALAGDSVMGLLFAGLGVFSLLAKTKKESDVPKLKKLK